MPVPKLLSTLCNTPVILSHFSTPQVTASLPVVYRLCTQYLLCTDDIVYIEHPKDVIREGSGYTVLLLLYTDEAQVSNPLGPQLRVRKLMAVYSRLLNLEVQVTTAEHLVITACALHLSED